MTIGPSAPFLIYQNKATNKTKTGLLSIFNTPLYTKVTVKVYK